MLNEMRCLAVLLTPLGNLSHCALKSFMERSRGGEEWNWKTKKSPAELIFSSARFMLN